MAGFVEGLATVKAQAALDRQNREDLHKKRTKDAQAFLLDEKQRQIEADRGSPDSAMSAKHRALTMRAAASAVAPALALTSPVAAETKSAPVGNPHRSIQDLLRQGQAQTVGGTTTRSTYTSPTLGPELLPEFAKIAATQKEAAQETSEAQQGIATKTQAIYADLAAEKERAKHGLEADAKGLQSQLGDAQDSVKRTREKLKGWKLNPERLYERMGTTGQLITLFAQVAERFGDNLSGRKFSGETVRMVNNAIARDISTQKTDFQKMLSEYKIDSSERDRMQTVFDRSMAKHEAAIREVAKLKLHELGAAQKGIAAKAAFHDLAAKIDSDLLGKKNATRAKVTSMSVRTPKRTVMTGATKTPPKAVVEGLEKAEIALKTLQDTERFIRQSGYGIAGRHIPRGVEKRIKDMYITPAGIALATATQKGTLSKQDVKPFNAMLGNTLDDGTELLKRINILKGKVNHAMQMTLRKNAPYYNVRPLAAQYLMAQKQSRPVTGAGKVKAR